MRVLPKGSPREKRKVAQMSPQEAGSIVVLEEDVLKSIHCGLLRV